MTARRFLPVVLLAMLAAGCTSSSSASSCGYDAASAISGPTRARLAQTKPRFHGTTARNAAWAAELEDFTESMPTDSVVRALIVHSSAVTEDDRLRVTGAGGTIADEPLAWNGIVALFTVAEVRAFATAHAELGRIYDVHLVTEVVLPPCD